MQDFILPEEEAFKVLMSELILDDDEMPVIIDGGISAASIMVTGEDCSRMALKNKYGTGCLSVILLITGITTIFLM